MVSNILFRPLHSANQVHVLGQGHGLVQVDKAWALLSAAQADPWGDVRVLLTVNSERFNRGIYLRQPHEASTANTFAVTAEPKFHEDTSPDVKVQVSRDILECGLNFPFRSLTYTLISFPTI